MKIAQLVDDAIRPLFNNLDIKLVEVEYLKKYDGMHLVVYLDKDSGISLEDCQNVSKMIDPIIEELNPTKDEKYYFDVSSYGLDRPLKHNWQLDKYIDQKLSVKLYMKVNGLKDFDAILKAYDNETVTLEIGENIVKLERKQIATLLPYIEF